MPSKIHHQDFFSETASGLGFYDVVSSFGFIEHFTDIRLTIRRHLDFIRPGGFLVITFPNHTGLYGRILRKVDLNAYQSHNLMSLQDLKNALSAISGVEVLYADYFGRIGFSASGLYELFLKYGKAAYHVLKIPFRIMERLGFLIPNSKMLSPYVGLIARKKA